MALAPATTIACDACGLLFPSEELLAKHKSRFCTGSDFDKALIERRRQRYEESSLAPDALASFLAGGAAPKALSQPGLEKLTVAELRQRIAAGQAGRDQLRAEQEAEEKRAAARLSSQRVRAEVQQRELQVLDVKRGRLRHRDVRVSSSSTRLQRHQRRALVDRRWGHLLPVPLIAQCLRG